MMLIVERGILCGPGHNKPRFPFRQTLFNNTEHSSGTIFVASSRSLDAINKIHYKLKMIAQFFIIYHVREMSELSESFFYFLLILSFSHPFGHDVIDNQDERESFI